MYHVGIMQDAIIHLLRPNAEGILESVANFGPFQDRSQMELALQVRDSLNADESQTMTQQRPSEFLKKNIDRP